MTQTKTLVTMMIALAAIAGLVANVAVMKMAYGQEASPHARYVVFLGFTDEQVAQERTLYARTFTDLPSEFAPLLRNESVQLVSAPHVVDLDTAYQYVLPALRATNPDAVFVFVTKDDMGYSILTSAKSGVERVAAHIPDGVAYVGEGFAIVNNSPYTISVVQHEMLHLVDCGDFHDEDGVTFADGHVVKYPGAEGLAWCQ